MTLAAKNSSKESLTTFKKSDINDSYRVFKNTFIIHYNINNSFVTIKYNLTC